LGGHDPRLAALLGAALLRVDHGLPAHLPRLAHLSLLRHVLALLRRHAPALDAVRDWAAHRHHLRHQLALVLDLALLGRLGLRPAHLLDAAVLLGLLYRTAHLLVGALPLDALHPSGVRRVAEHPAARHKGERGYAGQPADDTHHPAPRSVVEPNVILLDAR
jgi:hypothetical protein